VYFDLNVESIWSIGMARAWELELEVAAALRSSGECVWISMVVVVNLMWYVVVERQLKLLI
jgi:hypothetical protein